MNVYIITFKIIHRKAKCSFLFLHGKVTNDDVNLLMELTEAIVFKVIILMDTTLVRPASDKLPIIAVSQDKKPKVGIIEV